MHLVTLGHTDDAEVIVRRWEVGGDLLGSHTMPYHTNPESFWLQGNLPESWKLADLALKALYSSWKHGQTDFIFLARVTAPPLPCGRNDWLSFQKVIDWFIWKQSKIFIKIQLN